MLEKIGETLDNVDVFALSDAVAVDEDGLIYKIEKDELCDSIYCVANFEDLGSIDEIKSNIVNPFKLLVGEHRIDIIANKIDGASFKYIDDEENDFVAIKFKGNTLKMFDDGTNSLIINEKKFENHMKAIEKAYHYEVDEYEDFNTLRF